MNCHRGEKILELFAGELMKETPFWTAKSLFQRLIIFGLGLEAAELGLVLGRGILH
jgi:hypothetical protein